MKRRQFLQSLSTGAAFAALAPLVPGINGPSANAAPSSVKLNIVSRSIDIDGKSAKVFGLLGANGKPGFELMQDLDYEVELVNTLAEETMIHWHGLTPKWEMDGVPGMPMPMLKGGESRKFLLPSRKTGTHWMHAHTLQEQALMAAPLIVKPAPSTDRDEQDVVVLLHDFSFKSPEELLAGLKSGGMNGAMPGMNMQGMDHSKMGGMNMNGMNHSNMPGMAGGLMGMDTNDIEYDAYLANDRTLGDPEIVPVEKGGKVRLRIINGATATGFSIDTGQLSANIVAVDGQGIIPISKQYFPLAMGQRVDILLNIPPEGGAFPVLALREGAPQQAGIILATKGAQVTKISPTGSSVGPLLSLDAESLLRAPGSQSKAADQTFNVMLSGDMGSYNWRMTSNEELRVTKGERVRIQMMNHSMMSHPMHLHGHHFQIVNLNGNPVNGAVRDTVLVPPMASVAFEFDANNPGGGWAFHCHHLYHMASGMMSFIPYV